MKTFLFTIAILLSGFNLVAQLFISIPYERAYSINDFPKTNEKISFTLPHPFVDFKDSIPDQQTSYQFLITMPLIQDSLLSLYIKFAMLSLDFQQKYCNSKSDVAIWRGISKGNTPVYSGIYYKNSGDSSYIYVLTGYSLTYFDKKSKTNYSELICDRIKKIIESRKRK